MLIGPRRVRPTNAVRAVDSHAIVRSGPRSSCSRSLRVLGVTKYCPRGAAPAYSSITRDWRRTAACNRGPRRSLRRRLLGPRLLRGFLLAPDALDLRLRRVLELALDLLQHHFHPLTHHLATPTAA